MDSRIHMHLAGAKLQDSLPAAATARAARAVSRPRHGHLMTGLATAWQRKRQAPASSRLRSGAMTPQ